MALFGSDWKDDQTPHERFEEITGESLVNYSLSELRKNIALKIESGFTGRVERNELRGLESDINPENN